MSTSFVLCDASRFVSTSTGLHLARRDKPAKLLGSCPAVSLQHRESDTGLTARENELLNMLIEDCATNSDLASAMHISEETVKRHISNICNKTGFDTRLELAVRTLQGREDASIAEGIEEKTVISDRRILELELQLAESESRNAMHARVTRNWSVSHISA